MSKVKARVKVPKTAEKDEIVEIKTLISHPMHSGRGVDGDGNIVPRNIINSFTAKFNGKTVFNADFRPSVSSNPFLIFPFKVTEAGTFDFVWVEDGGKEYTASKKIKIA
ncbi:MAG: thiosulfate oxidation carrier complex protein SoxZ [Proteobacteria bacterium]|jgi:sulfur-oxidizing protein SoxZ|nr:thiosulfate oxidation carrier complex protein SoxZ [Pseudomonadota bacterium]